TRGGLRTRPPLRRNGIADTNDASEHGEISGFPTGRLGRIGGFYDRGDIEWEAGIDAHRKCRHILTCLRSIKRIQYACPLSDDRRMRDPLLAPGKGDAERSCNTGMDLRVPAGSISSGRS